MANQTIRQQLARKRNSSVQLLQEKLNANQRQSASTPVMGRSQVAIQVAKEAARLEREAWEAGSDKEYYDPDNSDVTAIGEGYDKRIMEQVRKMERLTAQRQSWFAVISADAVKAASSSSSSVQHVLAQQQQMALSSSSSPSAAAATKNKLKANNSQKGNSSAASKMNTKP